MFHRSTLVDLEFKVDTIKGLSSNPTWISILFYSIYIYKKFKYPLVFNSLRWYLHITICYSSLSLGMFWSTPNFFKYYVTNLYHVFFDLLLFIFSTSYKCLIFLCCCLVSPHNKPQTAQIFLQFWVLYPGLLNSI